MAEPQATFTREEVASIAAALDEFRNEFGPGLVGLASRVNEVLRMNAEDTFVLTATKGWLMSTAYKITRDELGVVVTHGNIDRFGRAAEVTDGVLYLYHGSDDPPEIFETPEDFDGR